MRWLWLIVLLALSVALGSLLRDIFRSDSAAQDALFELREIRKSLAELVTRQQKPGFVYCINATGRSMETQPVALLTAYALPHPPENTGRVIFYESFKKRDQDGKSTVIFREFRNGTFVETELPSSEIRWNAAGETH